MAKYLDQNGSKRLVDNLKTVHSALNTKINSEIVARENFATDATSSISAIDTKIDNATTDMIQTIALDGTTLSITSGAGSTDTYQIQDTTYDLATTINAGLMSSSDKAKLNNLASITSAGSNITISGGEISAANTTYSVATTTANGLMSSSDKAKLNGIAANANNYTLPKATSSTLGGVKVGSGISVSNGTISVPTVTSSANGLMSSSDKKKLDSLASITSAGDNITISGGTIKAGGSAYTLPTASTTQKGGIIVGDGLVMNGDTLNVTISGGATSQPNILNNPTLSGGIDSNFASIKAICSTINADRASIYAGNASIDAYRASIDADYASIGGDHVSIGVQYSTIGAQGSSIIAYNDKISVGGSTIDAQSSSINARYFTIGADYASINAGHSTIGTEYSTIDADGSTINAYRASIYAGGASIDAYRASIGGDQVSIGAQYSTIGARYSSIIAENDKISVGGSTIDAKSSSIDARYFTIGADYASINTEYSTIDADHASISADGSTINAYGSNVYAGGAKINANGASIGADYASIGAEYSTIGAECSTIDVFGSSIRAERATIGARYSAVDANCASISTDEFTTISGDLRFSGNPVFTNGTPTLSGGLVSRNTSIDLQGATIDAGGVSISGNPTLSGDPTFGGYVAFRKPITIFDTWSNSGNLSFEFVDGQPRLILSVGSTTYVFNSDGTG